MKKVVKRVSKAFDKALALNSKQRQGGFTLVELAIVIAVAAIIIAAIIYGAGALGTGAKVNRMMEFTKAVQTAAGVCKTKNPEGMMGLRNDNTSKANFDRMVQDSLCRLQGQGVPDGQGLIPGGVSAKLPPGITDYAIEYNRDTGGVKVTYTATDKKIAEVFANELKKFDPDAKVIDNTKVEFNLSL